MTHVNPSLDQDSFRGRNDDGSESAATWKASANTDWTQAVDENFRVRFLVQETAGGSENNVNLQLQYNINGAGWNSVNSTSSVVQSSLSANFADDDSTTQQLGAGTFITPNSGMDEDNGLAGENSDIDFAGNDEVEVEYCCQILSGDVADTDTIQLRVVRGDLTLLETYTNTPTVTVSEAGATATTGRISWAEKEAPFVATAGRIAQAEAEAPLVLTAGRISWAEKETTLAPTAGRLSQAETEVPDTGPSPTTGRVSQAEVETPLASTKGRLSQAETEAPFVATRGLLAWAETESPIVLTRGLLSHAGAEFPIAPTAGLLSQAELEVPSEGVQPTAGRVSRAEGEFPLVGTRGRLAQQEMEAPLAATRGRLSWAEKETPLGATRGRIALAEAEVLTVATTGRIGLAEFSVGAETRTPAPVYLWPVKRRAPYRSPVRTK